MDGYKLREEGITLEVTSELALLTLGDKAGGNRLYGERLSALKKALELAHGDAGVRLILLRAVAGAPWCLGMDLDRLGDSLGQAGGGREGAVALYSQVLSAISEGPKPVVAFIGSPVMAGGVGLAAACDIVLASPGASFELSEVYYGLIPANVLPHLLARRMPLQKVKYLVLTAKKVAAPEALSLGLVDELLPEEGLEEGCKRALRNLFRGEPGALAATKAFANHLDGLPRAQALADSQKEILRLMTGEAVGHALTALKEGQSPRWFGRLKTDRPLFFAPESHSNP